MLFIAGRSIAHHTVNAFRDPHTGRTFRRDVFTPMMAWTLRCIRHALDVSCADPTNADPEWSDANRRELFMDQIENLAKRHSDVYSIYLEPMPDGFDWANADMHRQYDIPEHGYQLLPSTSTDARMPAIPPFSPTNLSNGTTDFDNIWLSAPEALRRA
jgi:hypothetical protein